MNKELKPVNWRRMWRILESEVMMIRDEARDKEQVFSFQWVLNRMTAIEDEEKEQAGH